MNIDFTVDCIEIYYRQAKIHKEGKGWFIEKANKQFMNKLDELTPNQITFFTGLCESIGICIIKIRQ